MVGLFFLMKNQNGNFACIPQATVMIILTVLTGIYQILLNQSFGPVFRHLPITLEDDVVIRDETFAHAQAARFNDDYEEDEEDKMTNQACEGPSHDIREDEDIEMRKIPRPTTNPKERKYNRLTREVASLVLRLGPHEAQQRSGVKLSAATTLAMMK